MKILILALCIVSSFAAVSARATDTSVAEVAKNSQKEFEPNDTVAPAIKETVTPDAAKAEGMQPVLKNESEIPLNLETPKKSGDEGHPLFRILFAFSLMGLVGAGAVLFVRKYSKANFALGKHTQIKILTQHYLGPKKSLAIVRVAGESILIGVTDHNISMIKSLSLLDEEIPEATPSHFSDVLASNVSERVTFNARPSKSEETEAAADEEEFSTQRLGDIVRRASAPKTEENPMRGIKDVVSKKLKGMRTIQ